MALTVRIGVVQAELASNPLGRNYAGTDQAVADSFNAVNRQRNRVSMTGSEIARHIVESEWDLIVDATLRSDVLGLLGIDDIDPFGFAVVVMKRAFGGGSATLAALAAARVETISRGQELGLGTVLGSDIDHARNN
jgi:hypothetical protein